MTNLLTGGRGESPNRCCGSLACCGHGSTRGTPARCCSNCRRETSGNHPYQHLWDLKQGFCCLGKMIHTNPSTIPIHCRSYRTALVHSLFSVQRGAFGSRNFQNAKPLHPGCRCRRIGSPCFGRRPGAAYSHSASVGKR